MPSISATVIDLARLPFHQQAAEQLNGNLTVIGKNETGQEIKFHSDAFSTGRLPGNKAVIEVQLPDNLDELNSNVPYWNKVEELYQASLKPGKESK